MCSFLGGECNPFFSATAVPFWGKTMHNRKTSILCVFRINNVFFSFGVLVLCLTFINISLGGKGFASFGAQEFIRFDETTVLL